MIKQLGIRSQQRQRKYRYSKDGVDNIHSPNLLNRNFDVTAPNQVWCGDITYIWSGSGWLYLAVVLELYARKVVGFSLSNSPMERFFGSLKSEWVPKKGYSNKEVAKSDIFHYLLIYYNQ